MGIANEIGSLIQDMNISRVSGTFHFLGGVGSNVGYGNYAKLYYDQFFVPNMNFFRKALKPMPILLRDRQRPFNRQQIIAKRMPIGVNEVNDKYLSWDSFIDSEKVLNFDFTKDKPTTETINGCVGFVVMEEPFFKKENLGYRKDVLKEGTDMASMLSLMLGVCPRMNPLVKRIIGFEIAKRLKEEGLSVSSEGNDLVLRVPFQYTTSGFFGNIIKKTIKSLRSTGLKIQKQLLDPVREYLKYRVPGVWKTIDKLDKSAGLTKSLKKFSGTVENIAKKYGEQLMNTAILATVSIVGTPAAGAAAGMLLKMADALSTQEKKVLEQVVKKEGKIEEIDKKSMVELTTSLFDKIKTTMVVSKGKEGEKDFKQLLEFASETIKDQPKGIDESEAKVVKGIGINIIPITKNEITLAGVIFNNL